MNGSIDLQKGTEVGDDVSTVNGSIYLEETEVQQDVETVNGDIRLSDGSVVQGDVVFGEYGSNYHRPHNLPKLVVDASSAIKGSVHLYRKVQLQIDDDADVGVVTNKYY